MRCSSRKGKDPRPAGTTAEAAVNPKLFPPLIDYMVKQGVYINPTLVLSWAGGTERWRDWTAAAAALVKDPNLAFVPADVKAAWMREPGRARAGYANVAVFLRKYSEAGGKVLAATDTGCCTQIIPGLSLHYEMQMLTDMGITPMKALQGATLWAAEVDRSAEGSRQHRAGQARRLHHHRRESAGRHRRDEERAHGDQGRRGDGHHLRSEVGQSDPKARRGSLTGSGRGSAVTSFGGRGVNQRSRDCQGFVAVVFCLTPVRRKSARDVSPMSFPM